MERQASLFGVFLGSGVAIGVATHHLAIGIAVGVAMAFLMRRVARGKEEGSQT